MIKKVLYLLFSANIFLAIPVTDSLATQKDKENKSAKVPGKKKNGLLSGLKNLAAKINISLPKLQKVRIQTPASEDICQIDKEKNFIDLENRAFWKPYDQVGSSFTDPKNHNNKNFQYTVISFDSEAKAQQLIDEPDLLQKYLLSTTVISNERYKTFYPCGVIVKIPEENIFAASEEDLAIDNSAIKDPESLKEELLTVNNDAGIKTPDDVLENTSSFRHNEVVALGTNPENSHLKVEIIGTFVINVPWGGDSCKNSVENKLKELAEKISVPEVVIKPSLN